METIRSNIIWTFPALQRGRKSFYKKPSRDLIDQYWDERVTNYISFAVEWGLGHLDNICRQLR